MLTVLKDHLKVCGIISYGFVSHPVTQRHNTHYEKVASVLVANVLQELSKLYLLQLVYNEIR